VERIKTDNVSNIKANAKALVECFLTTGVDTEVNISDNMKKELAGLALEEDIEEHHTDFMKALDRAENEVMRILAMGAFPRFLKTEHFLNYKAKASELRERENEASIRRVEKASKKH
jgi:hypothetical protein